MEEPKVITAPKTEKTREGWNFEKGSVPIPRRQGRAKQGNDRNNNNRNPKPRLT